MDDDGAVSRRKSSLQRLPLLARTGVFPMAERARARMDLEGDTWL